MNCWRVKYPFQRPQKYLNSSTTVLGASSYWAESLLLQLYDRRRFKEQNFLFPLLILLHGLCISHESQPRASPSPPSLERRHREGQGNTTTVKDITATINMSSKQRFHDSHRREGGTPVKQSLKTASTQLKRAQHGISGTVSCEGWQNLALVISSACPSNRSAN